jgi:hypothetical protein
MCPRWAWLGCWDFLLCFRFHEDAQLLARVLNRPKLWGKAANTPFRRMATCTHLGPQAIEWVRSTYLYVRLHRDPGRYGAPPGASVRALDQWLRETVVLSTVQQLAQHGMVSTQQAHMCVDSGRRAHLTHQQRMSLVLELGYSDPFIVMPGHLIYDCHLGSTAHCSACLPGAPAR